MLYDPVRHEPLQPLPWDESRARDAIHAIVRDAESAFDPERLWAIHPRDADEGEILPFCPLYFGAAGVIWALHHLETLGAARLDRAYARVLPGLVERNRQWLRSGGSDADASYLMGETGILLVQAMLEPSARVTDALAALIASNADHPSRELMWGAPGTLLASLFLHEQTHEPRFADLFRTTARTLDRRLLWSAENGCHYWTQDLYGQRTTYLDAVHGFVATASPLARGRHLLRAEEWQQWETRIANTIERTATREDDLVNWRVFLDVPPRAGHWLMQFCHGAPGFVICLGDFPGTRLDRLLADAGESVWRAGPLIKGSNLCHGTGGNGYAFLKLHRRTGEARWLERARAFAMHGIVQTETERAREARGRYSLWTGDVGFAIYLWDCIHATAQFPSLDVFFPAPADDTTRVLGP